MMRRIGALASVCALAVAGVAPAAQGQTYTGRTSQRDGSISLTVKGGKVVHVSFVAGNGHGSGCTEAAAPLPKFPVTFKPRWTISKHGTFSGTVSPRDQEVFKITGRVTGSKITGSFTDQIPLGQLTSHPVTCRSGKVTFTAVRPTHAADTGHDPRGPSRDTGWGTAALHAQLRGDHGERRRVHGGVQETWWRSSATL